MKLLAPGSGLTQTPGVAAIGDGRVSLLFSVTLSKIENALCSLQHHVRFHFTFVCIYWTLQRWVGGVGLLDNAEQTHHWNQSNGEKSRWLWQITSKESDSWCLIPELPPGEPRHWILSFIAGCDQFTCGLLTGPQCMWPSFDWPVCFLWNGTGGFQTVWVQGKTGC